MRRPRIGFLTALDARQPIGWSGTPYYMARALAEHCGEVVHLGPVFSTVEWLDRVRARLLRTLGRRAYAREHTLALARSYARALRRRIPSDLDVLVAPAASACIAFLETDRPIFYTSDATVALVLDYYPVYSGLADRYVRQAHEVERRALERAALALYPSRWAAGSARLHYGVPEEKLRVLPYGANMEQMPPLAAVLAAERDDPCAVLFLGVDWERKGGPIAYEAVAALRRMGVPAELRVCGCVPPESYRAEWMRVIPRLDKRDAADRAALSRLLLSAKFLLVPSRQECYGVVYCEASGHGTPSVATETGGVAGAIRHGENGFLLPPGSAPEAYAGLMAEIVGDRSRYAALVASSRRAYDERLNWGAWARSVRGMVADLPAGGV